MGEYVTMLEEQEDSTKVRGRLYWDECRVLGHMRC
jgi:hypothetical protein